MVYAMHMGRTNIEIDEKLVRKARKLTRLKTKREIVDRALELLVRSESRKGILRHYGSGICKGVSLTTIDALIAAIAVEHRASVFTLDKDFSRIARLTGLPLHALPMA